MSVWFVTPAWKRYQVSELCFEQRRWMMDVLAERGIESESVIVADDGNLDLARKFGFQTLERDNEWLGKRFNDGIEYAAKHGATWIVPIGSDSWLAPGYIDPLPDKALTRTSLYYALATRLDLAELRITGNGVGPYMIHRDRLPKNRRPSEDKIASSVDGSTLDGLRDVKWEFRDVHPFQYLALRPNNVPQLHDFDSLYRRFGMVNHHSGMAKRLTSIYPDHLVRKAIRLLGSQR